MESVAKIHKIILIFSKAANLTDFKVAIMLDGHGPVYDSQYVCHKESSVSKAKLNNRASHNNKIKQQLDLNSSFQSVPSLLKDTIFSGMIHNPF